MIKTHNQTPSTLTFPLGERIRERHMADVTVLNAVLPISQCAHQHGWLLQEPACCWFSPVFPLIALERVDCFSESGWEDVLHWLVVELCAAEMSQSRVCPRLPSSAVHYPKLNSPSPAWSGVFAIPVRGSEIRGKWRGRRMYCHCSCSLWTGGLEETAAGFETGHPAVFLQHYPLPIHPFFASARALSPFQNEFPSHT